MKTFKPFDSMSELDQEDHLIDEHLFDYAGRDRDRDDEDHATAHHTGQLIWNEHTHEEN